MPDPQRPWLISKPPSYNADPDRPWRSGEKPPRRLGLQAATLEPVQSKRPTVDAPDSQLIPLYPPGLDTPQNQYSHYETRQDPRPRGKYENWIEEKPLGLQESAREILGGMVTGFVGMDPAKEYPEYSERPALQVARLLGEFGPVGGAISGAKWLLRPLAKKVTESAAKLGAEGAINVTKRQLAKQAAKEIGLRTAEGAVAGAGFGAAKQGVNALTREPIQLSDLVTGEGREGFSPTDVGIEAAFWGGMEGVLGTFGSVGRMIKTAIRGGKYRAAEALYRDAVKEMPELRVPQIEQFLNRKEQLRIGYNPPPGTGDNFTFRDPNVAELRGDIPAQRRLTGPQERPALTYQPQAGQGYGPEGDFTFRDPNAEDAAMAMESRLGDLAESQTAYEMPRRRLALESRLSDLAESVDNAGAEQPVAGQVQRVIPTPTSTVTDPVQKNMPSWVRERMIDEGLDPARPFNDYDLADPNIRKLIDADPTLTPEQKIRTLRTGSPRVTPTESVPKPEVSVELPPKAPAPAEKTLQERHDEIWREEAKRTGGTFDPQSGTARQVSARTLERLREEVGNPKLSYQDISANRRGEAIEPPRPPMDEPPEAAGVVSPKEPVTPAPSAGAAEKPIWDMTSGEYRFTQHKPIYDAVVNAIKSGKPIYVRTMTRAIKLTNPEHIRITKNGTIQIPSGRKWDSLIENQVDDIGAQAGITPVELGKKRYHLDEVKAAAERGEFGAGINEYADIAKKYQKKQKNTLVDDANAAIDEYVAFMAELGGNGQTAKSVAKRGLVPILTLLEGSRPLSMETIVQKISSLGKEGARATRDHMAWLKERGYIKTLWDKNGEVYYTRPGKTVPDGLTDNYEATFGAADAAVSPVGKAKEPWEMTADEWIAEKDKVRPNAQGTGGGGYQTNIGKSVKGAERSADVMVKRLNELNYGVKKIDPDTRMAEPIAHRDVIAKAVAEGKPVPPEVLKDYPDLAGKPAEPAYIPDGVKPPEVAAAPAKSVNTDALPMGWRRSTYEWIDKRGKSYKREPQDLTSIKFTRESYKFREKPSEEAKKELRAQKFRPTDKSQLTWVGPKVKVQPGQTPSKMIATDTRGATPDITAIKKGDSIFFTMPGFKKLHNGKIQDEITKDGVVEYYQVKSRGQLYTVPVGDVFLSRRTEGIRKYNAAFTALPPEQRAAARADSKAFDDLLMANIERILPEERIKEVYGEGFAGDKGGKVKSQAMANQALLNEARQFAAANLQISDVTNPVERANALEKLKELLGKTETGMVSESTVKRTAGDLDLKVGDEVRIEGDWHRVVAKGDGEVTLADGRVFTIDDTFDELPVDIKPGGEPIIERGVAPTNTNVQKIAEESFDNPFGAIVKRQATPEELAAAEAQAKGGAAPKVEPEPTPEPTPTDGPRESYQMPADEWLALDGKETAAVRNQASKEAIEYADNQVRQAFAGASPDNPIMWKDSHGETHRIVGFENNMPIEQFGKDPNDLSPYLYAGRDLGVARPTLPENTHKYAIAKALTDGRMSPEQAQALGHFDTYPELKEKFGKPAKKLDGIKPNGDVSSEAAAGLDERGISDLQNKLGHAGRVEPNGDITTWHVTDNPERVAEQLRKGEDISKSYGEERMPELGAGVYGSSTPQLWMSRSTSKWGFLDTMDDAEWNRFLDAIKNHPNVTETGYLSQAERDILNRDIELLRQGKISREALTQFAGQPYNIRMWEPEFLQGLNITPGRQPEVVEMVLRGKFAKADRAYLSPETIERLKNEGYDGAFISGGWEGDPQLVTWNNKAVRKFGDYFDAEPAIKTGQADRQVGYSSHGEFADATEIYTLERERGNVVTSVINDPSLEAIWTTEKPEHAVRYNRAADDLDRPATKDEISEINEVDLRGAEKVPIMDDGDGGSLWVRRKDGKPLSHEQRKALRNAVEEPEIKTEATAAGDQITFAGQREIPRDKIRSVGKKAKNVQSQGDLMNPGKIAVGNLPQDQVSMFGKSGDDAATAYDWRTDPDISPEIKAHRQELLEKAAAYDAAKSGAVISDVTPPGYGPGGAEVSYNPMNDPNIPPVMKAAIQSIENAKARQGAGAREVVIFDNPPPGGWTEADRVPRKNAAIKAVDQGADQAKAIQPDPLFTPPPQTKPVESNVLREFSLDPEKSVRIEKNKGIKDWQVLEGNWLARKKMQRIENYKRGIADYEKQISELGPKATTKRQSLQTTVDIWKRDLKDIIAGTNRGQLTGDHSDYVKIVRQAISKGEKVPKEVIAQYPEFTKAINARARYDKGVHTSFANQSIAVNASMKAERGFKVKRQDGKEMTPVQIREITEGVSEVESVFGPMKDLFDKTDPTIAHTNGKHPFLRTAGGLYSPDERTITVGVTDLIGRPVRALAHELAHWLDFEAGAVQGLKSRLRFKSFKYAESSYASEFNANKWNREKGAYELERQLIEEAEKSINNTYEIRNIFRKHLNKIDNEDEKALVERVKIHLSDYWREPREIFARLMEQFVGTKLAKESLAAHSAEYYSKVPGYWTQEQFAKMMPKIEALVQQKINALRNYEAVKNYKPDTKSGQTLFTPIGGLLGFGTQEDGEGNTTFTFDPIKALIGLGVTAAAGLAMTRGQQIREARRLAREGAMSSKAAAQIEKAALTGERVEVFKAGTSQEELKLGDAMVTKVHPNPAPVTQEGRIAGINVNNFQIEDEARTILKETIEKVRPEIEAIKGPVRTMEELEVAANMSKVLKNTVTREESLRVDAMVKATQQEIARLSAKAERGAGLEEAEWTKYMEMIQALSTEASARGRALQALSGSIDPAESVMSQVIRRILQVSDDSAAIIADAKNVDWRNGDAITKFFRKHVPATFLEKLSEYRYINLLSSPRTHIINAFSNFLQATALRPATIMATGTVDMMAAALTGREQQRYIREVLPYYKGMFNSVGKASAGALDALSGRKLMERPDLDHIAAGSKWLEKTKLVYIPRALDAMDVFFRTLVKGGEYEALAARAKVSGQPITKAKLREIKDQADEQALYTVFRKPLDPKNESGQGTLLSLIDKGAGAVKMFPGARWYVPFIQTPTNILKQGIEYSPMGLLTLAKNKDKVQQLGKMAVGSTVFAGAMYMAMSGNTTWAVPRGKREREMFFAAGMQPYSVKIGDTWYSYSKLGPLSYPIAMAAAFRYHSTDSTSSLSDDKLKVAAEVLGGISEFFSDQSYVQGMGELLGVLTGEPGSGAKAVTNIPRQFIPLSALQNWIAGIMDPIYRKADKDLSVPAIVDNLKKGIPFLSEQVDPYTNLVGEPSERPSPFGNAFSPVQFRGDSEKSSVYREIRQRQQEADLMAKQKESMYDSLGTDMAKDPIKAQQILENAVASGMIDRKRAKELLGSMRYSPEVQKFYRLDLQTAIDAYRLGKPETKAVLAPHLMSMIKKWNKGASPATRQRLMPEVEKILPELEQLSR